MEFFTKMSLRGKIASVIICIFLLTIIILIGTAIYKSVHAAESEGKAESYIIYDENTDIGKNENKNEIITKNEVPENKTQEIEDNKNIIIVENNVEENKLIENKTEENKVAETNTEKENKNVVPENKENAENKTSEENKEKTAATEGEKGVIYLTFDDGPSTNITPKILDILKEENVKATFFVLNYNSEGEKIIKRAYSEGHAIGIHGYSHKYEDIYK